MSRWLHLLVNLYPARWRSRYGEEFQALLEDVRPGWRELADILRGALIMQITEGSAFLKLAAALSVAGALIAAGFSFAVPRRYVSSAVVAVTPAKDDVDEFAIARAELARENMLSRGMLAAMILKLDLYHAERFRIPMEDIIDRMRERDIRITELDGGQFRISFTYPDRDSAQAVTRKLVVVFLESNVVADRNRTKIWHQFNADVSKAYHQALPQPDPPAGMTAAVVRPPSLAERGEGPNRWLFAGCGLLAGAAIAFAIRQPKRSLRVLAGAIAGGALAFAISYLVPETFVSTATVRFFPPMIPERLVGVAMPSPSEQFEQIKRDLLSDENLARLAGDKALPLTSRDPAVLRQAIQIRPNGSAHGPLFEISVSYGKRFVAKQLADQLVAGAMRRAVIARKNLAISSANALFRDLEAHRAGQNLEVLDPASLPIAPVTPSRVTFAATGASIGILGCLLLLASAGYRKLNFFIL